MSVPTRGACLACGGALSADRLQVPEMMFGSDERFHYAACAECASLTLVDPPSDPSRYYPSGYYSFSASSTAPGLAWRLRSRRDRFTIFGRPRHAALLQLLFGRSWIGRWLSFVRLRPSDPVLDVGTGSGALLHQLRRIGFTDLTGVDPYLDAELSRPGFRLIRATLAETEGTYRVVMLHHVLEHLAEPVDTLRRVRALLAPDGYAVVRVPLASSWAFAHYGASWVQMDAPRHQVLFTDAGLRAAAGAAGLRVLGHEQDSTELQFWGSEAYLSGVSLMEAPWPRGLARRRLLRRAARLNRRGEGDQGVFYLAAG